MLEIESLGKTLFDSKSFIALGLGETHVDLIDENERIRITFLFESKKDSDQTVDYKIIDENTLLITLVNWNSSIATTINGSLNIGSLSNRTLFLIYCVKKIGTKGELREITVSTYLGDEVQHG